MPTTEASSSVRERVSLSSSRGRLLFVIVSRRRRRRPSPRRRRRLFSHHQPPPSSPLVFSAPRTTAAPQSLSFSYSRSRLNFSDTLSSRGFPCIFYTWKRSDISTKSVRLSDRIVYTPSDTFAASSFDDARCCCCCYNYYRYHSFSPRVLSARTSRISEVSNNPSPGARVCYTGGMVLRRIKVSPP